MAQIQKRTGEWGGEGTKRNVCTYTKIIGAYVNDKFTVILYFKKYIFF